MNKAGILHIPDSNYCFPVGKNELVFRLRLAKEDRNTRVFLIYGMKYDFYKKRNEVELTLSYEDRTFVYYEGKPVLSDSRLGYIFRLEGEGETLFFCEDGVTDEYDFLGSRYHFFQKPYINEADILPTIPWMKEAVFYQIFIDRFKRGDFEKEDSYITMKWGGTPTSKNFAGGDLKGITEELDYIADLGVTALYLTPIFKSPSNHKYDTDDYYEVDPQFGTKEDLRTLVKSAHQRGIRIILDAVFNHSGVNGKEFRDVSEKGRESKYYDWFLIDGDRPDVQKRNYECFAASASMPKWNTSNPKVQDHLIDIGVYWIKEFDIDGWRLDVADEVSYQFWRRFRTAVKAAKEDAVLIGENWHDAGPFLKGDQYDGIMNYAFTKACLNCFAHERFSAKDLSEQLSHILMRNIDPVNRMNLNLLDSHDTHRIFTELHQSEEKLSAALALAFLFPGAPCLYYGTEICMEGGHDPDSRRTFDWEAAGRKSEMKDRIKELASLKKEKCIQEGEVKIGFDADIFLLERSFEGESVKFFLNLGKEEKEISAGETMLLSHGFTDGSLKPYGYAVMKESAS